MGRVYHLRNPLPFSALLWYIVILHDEYASLTRRGNETLLKTPGNLEDDLEYAACDARRYDLNILLAFTNPFATECSLQGGMQRPVGTVTGVA